MSTEPKQIDDLVGEGSLGYGADGYYATRVFIVNDLTGNSAQRLYEALCRPHIPRRGHPHPAQIGLPVDEIRAESIPHSPSKAKVTVTYKAPRAGTSDPEPGDAPQITLSTSLQSIETHFDADGKQIVTEHEGEKQVATIAQGVPVTTVYYRRREAANDVLDPRDYIGKVNSDEQFAGGVRCWLCSQMDRESTDGGITYIVTYGFQWSGPKTLKKADGSPIVSNVPGWDVFAIHLDSEGKPISDPKLGTSLKVVQLYEAVSFAPLNLTYTS